MIDLGFLSRFLSDPTDGRAIVLGIVVCWAVTDGAHKWPAKVLSGALGACVTFLLCRDPVDERTALALTVGLVAPFIYPWVLKSILHYLPWLENKTP